jgi:tocopherol cyclase
MEHFAPHPSAMFEGYYSKFRLPSGSHVALIICTVPNATTHPPHMVSFTYYPSSPSPTTPIYQREHWVSSLSFKETGAGHAFVLSAPGLGSMSVAADSTTTYDLECDEWSLQGMTTDRTPWNEGETPEGVLVRLPLPLHWHVHSLSSSCAFKLRIRDVELPKEDQKGRASVHQEKNWAGSFPESHMWVQASDEDGDGGRRGVCLAGGKILGMTAYILGYRSPDLNIDFKPPFALAVLGMSPFMGVNVDWENRKFETSVAGLWRKIVIKAQAPKEKGWFGLGAPFKEGHRENFCTESFSAVVEVEVSERTWPWEAWREVRRERFEHGSLEFGGGYFPERGLKKD